MIATGNSLSERVVTYPLDTVREVCYTCQLRSEGSYKSTVTVSVTGLLCVSWTV